MPVAVVLAWIGAVLGGAVAYERTMEARSVVAEWQLVEATVLRITHHRSAGSRHAPSHESTVITWSYMLDGPRREANAMFSRIERLGAVPLNGF